MNECVRQILCSNNQPLTGQSELKEPDMVSCTITYLLYIGYACPAQPLRKNRWTIKQHELRLGTSLGTYDTPIELLTVVPIEKDLKQFNITKFIHLYTAVQGDPNGVSLHKAVFTFLMSTAYGTYMRFHDPKSGKVQ